MAHGADSVEDLIPVGPARSRQNGLPGEQGLGQALFGLLPPMGVSRDVRVAAVSIRIPPQSSPRPQPHYDVSCRLTIRLKPRRNTPLMLGTLQRARSMVSVLPPWSMPALAWLRSFVSRRSSEVIDYLMNSESRFSSKEKISRSPVLIRFAVCTI